jgi:hypothetical protein
MSGVSRRCASGSTIREDAFALHNPDRPECTYRLHSLPTRLYTHQLSFSDAASQIRFGSGRGRCGLRLHNEIFRLAHAATPLLWCCTAAGIIKLSSHTRSNT